MKIAVISFTRAGSDVCRRLVKIFQESGEKCTGYVQRRFLSGSEEKGICALAETLSDWTGRAFVEVDAIVFVGAAGIAVRAVAPYLRDKFTDPAVLVLDERAQYVIPLLSGHVGGANALAERIAAFLGAVPVVTTASDVQGLVAVDVWAKEQGLAIADKALAKRVASAVVDGETVGFFCDFPWSGRLPDGFKEGKFCRNHVWVTDRAPEDLLQSFLAAQTGKYRLDPCEFPLISGEKKGFSCEAMGLSKDAAVLRLIPKTLTIGIGCRKDIAFENVRLAVETMLTGHGLDIRAVREIASIDLKENEPALVKLGEVLGVPFVTFSAEELQKTQGEFAESSFVQRVTGVGNVCERAAVFAASRTGKTAKLLVKKEIFDGVTVAAARMGDSLIWRK